MRSGPVFKNQPVFENQMMREFRVWAPDARSVRLRIGEDLHDLDPSESGWWSAILEAPDGADYFFVLNDGPRLPDPRSSWQPLGVHGPSRIVDHRTFEWRDQGWQAPPLSFAVIYELHIGTFTEKGTFESAAARLDHLVRLGISHIELMPVQEFSGQWGWGYDGVDLFAPHQAYGSPAELKQFVNACHARGIAVVLDVVYNHAGPTGNYLGRFGPYFTTQYSTPWGAAINLDGPGSFEVRRFLCDNALMWLRDYHFDGLRLDAVHAIFDSSALHFLAQLTQEVRELEARVGRHFVLIAESDLNDPKVVMPCEAGGYGMDAQWNDDFHHALHTTLTNEQTGYYEDFHGLGDLAEALEKVFVYRGRYSVHRRRQHGRAPNGLPGWRFLGFSQNHDQVGNRAQGDRSSRLMSIGHLKIASALVFCAPFVPLLFQGEEYGATTPFQYFSHHDDPEIACAVTAGRRQEFRSFGWDPDEIPDPQDPATFLRSKLDWSELSRAPHTGLLDWYRRLISLRRSTRALSDGRLDKVCVRFSEAERWITLRRGPVAVACNLGAARRTVPLPCCGAPLLWSEPGCTLRADIAELPPDSVMIIRGDA